MLLIDRLKDVKLRAGLELKLNVPFDGSPAPSVTWKKDGSELRGNDHVQIENVEELTTLRAKECQRDDTGEYELILIYKDILMLQMLLIISVIQIY